MEKHGLPTRRYFRINILPVIAPSLKLRAMHVMPEAYSI
jgi:hypothetical protein